MFHPTTLKFCILVAISYGVVLVVVIVVVVYHIDMNDKMGHQDSQINIKKIKWVASKNMMFPKLTPHKYNTT